MVRIGINGFGRIGRSFVRALLARQSADPVFREVEVVAVNDLGSRDQLLHLLKYDSNYGPLQGTVSATEGGFALNGKAISVTAERNPEALNWAALGVDIVVESTGVFTDANKARAHLAAGAKKVVISAPASNEDLTLVFGVNHERYNRQSHRIVSNASCTTNCLAPVAKVIHDNLGIESGFVTTVHAYTQDQNLQDAPHRDLRRARSAATNIIPTSTGAAKAIGLVIPELDGRLDGSSMRVPVPTGSMIDCGFMLARDTSASEINSIMKSAAGNQLKGILRYADDPLVSSDIVGDPHSAIFDSLLTRVIRGRHVKLVAWYDNEWGFANRLLDTVKYIS